jgi:hypothetical protein
MTFCVPDDKENIERKAFIDIDNIRSIAARALKAISQNQFQNWFEGWARPLHRYLASEEQCFEDDHNNIQQ